jgi:hypothetical protein
MPEEIIEMFGILEEEISPSVVIGKLILSDGTNIEVKDVPIGSTQVTFRRITGYTGDCVINLAISSEESAEDEIKAALETELVSKTKVDLDTKEQILVKISKVQQEVQELGYTCSNGIKLQTREEDLIRWTQLTTTLLAFQPVEVVIRDYYNKNHTLPIKDVMVMMGEIAVWGQAALQRTWAAKDEILND